MKRLFFYIAIFATMSAGAQSNNISFENSWKKGSDVVYAGVVNRLILTGNLEDIKYIRCSSGSVSRNGDTLLVIPSPGSTGGALRIGIETTDGIDSLILNSERLPLPEISISGVQGMLTEISREKFLESPELHVTAQNSRNENIFEGYRLVEYDVTVGNKIFKQTDSVFSNDLKTSISTLAPGKTFSVSDVTLLNPETGKKFTISFHKVFRLN